MLNIQERTEILVKKLGLNYHPVALLFSDEMPEGSMYLKKAGNACVAPLIFSAAKGKTVFIDSNSTGYACSAFYLGYEKWIFNGIEYFLSNSASPLPNGRTCERFVKSPELAKEYVSSFIPEEVRKNAYVFKPVEKLNESEKPEVVILFANPDQISALVFLIHYNTPNNFNRIETGFASSCGAMTTFPLRFASEGKKKAFWGLHDPAQRLSFPAEITSLAMPLNLYHEILEILDESFLSTHVWEKVLSRINGKENQ